jgi:hypothetical protein
VELAQARAECEAERQAVTQGCARRRTRVRSTAAERIASAKAEAKERIELDRAEKRRQRGDRAASSKRKARGESRAESDDAVAREVEHWEPRLASTWQRLRRQFKDGTAHQRFEAFQHYVHDNGGANAFAPELPSDDELAADFARYWKEVG